MDEVFFNCSDYELCGAMDSLLSAIHYGEELLAAGAIFAWNAWSLNRFGLVDQKLAEGK